MDFLTFCSDLESGSLTFLQIRESAGLTQLRVSQILDVTETTVANWEKGRSLNNEQLNIRTKYARAYYQIYMGQLR
jgi:DNA-binding XRE family transcriptional regulator